MNNVKITPAGTTEPNVSAQNEVAKKAPVQISEPEADQQLPIRPHCTIYYPLDWKLHLEITEYQTLRYYAAWSRIVAVPDPDDEFGRWTQELLFTN